MDTTIQLAAGFTPLPQRIQRLLELAYNLWWSWHPEASELYQKIDDDLWEEVYHNPVKFLREVRQSALDAAAKDADFLRAYHAVLAEFDAYQVFDKTWYARQYGDLKGKTIAYFSAEFGLPESLHHLFRRLGHSVRRPHQRSQRFGLAADGCWVFVPAGIFQTGDYRRWHARSHLPKSAFHRSTRPARI